MLDEEEYASSTDESDDDYKPDGYNSDVPSEIDTDDEAEDIDDTDDKDLKKSRKRKPASTKISNAKKKKDDDSKEKFQEKTNSYDAKNNCDISKAVGDDDDDENEDAIWASFLNKTGQTQNPTDSLPPSNSNEAQTTKPEKTSQLASSIVSNSINTEKTKTVTEIFEFAGEKVEVKKNIKVDNEKANSDASVSSTTISNSTNVSISKPKVTASRSGGGSGLSSVLGQLGRKNKLSVLQKSQLDWSGFKQNEGIDEEIQTFNKGRDGFLERQDFLQRTDLRQFEIEKSLRQTTKRK